jgi:hypothetical protein
LAFLTQKTPDLALLVERWDALPDAVRAGIAAMVRAADLALETGLDRRRCCGVATTARRRNGVADDG